MTDYYVQFKPKFNEIGIDVSRETFDKLSVYVYELLRWSNKHNLIAKSTYEEVWLRHILDSAQLVRLLASENSLSILDMGTGGGLPSVVLSLLTDHSITCVDARSKKTAFLNYIKGKLSLNLNIVHGRLEDEKIGIGVFDVITARAFASLIKIIPFHLKFSSYESRGFYFKGKNFAQEIDEARTKYDFQAKCHESLTSSYSQIIEIKVGVE